MCVCVCVRVCVCVCGVCLWGSGVCVPNMLRNQKLSGQSRTFFFHMSKQLVIAYDLRLQCVGGQMISKHFLIRENEPSPASVSQPGRVVKCWEGWVDNFDLVYCREREPCKRAAESHQVKETEGSSVV